MTFRGPILLSTAGSNFLSILIPFLFSASLMAIVFFIMRFVHKKRHPTEDDVKETNRKRREREKLKRETMEKVTDKLSCVKQSGEAKEKNGLRYLIFRRRIFGKMPQNPAAVSYSPAGL